MKLDREQIVKALECCNRNPDCDVCPYFGRCWGVGKDALALLREKDAVIERLTGICDSYALQYGSAVDKELLLKQERADIVRKTIDAARKQAFIAGDQQYISIAELEEIIQA